MATNSLNWHWKTKDVRSWAKAWFKTELVNLSVGNVKVTEVTDVRGDCEVGMRKSKVITFYDQKVITKWSGSKNGNEASGTLTALEVAHDMDEDDYKFESSLDSGSGSDAEALYKEARTSLADAMRTIFQKFTNDAIETHGKDLLVATPTSSGAATPANVAEPADAPKVAAASEQKSSTTATTSATGTSKMHVNVTKVQAKAELTITAPDLFDLVTVKEKVSTWTRNKAEIEPKEGADVSLFNGNVTGKIVTVNKPKSLVMTWRAPTWPEGHFGNLTMTFEQGSASTELQLVLEGVPIGQEDDTQRNLDFYYIRSLKQLGSAFFFSKINGRRKRAPIQNDNVLLIMLFFALSAMAFAIYVRLK